MVPHAQAMTEVSGEQAEELVDVRAVARLLSCSQRHVYRLADAGKMPKPLRLGTLNRWSRQAIMRWINDGCPSMRRGARR